MFEPQVHSLLRKNQSENSVEHFDWNLNQKNYRNNCDLNHINISVDPNWGDEQSVLIRNRRMNIDNV